MHHDKIRLKKEGELYLYVRAGNVFPTQKTSECNSQGVFIEENKIMCMGEIKGGFAVRKFSARIKIQILAR